MVIKYKYMLSISTRISKESQKDKTKLKDCDIRNYHFSEIWGGSAGL